MATKTIVCNEFLTCNVTKMWFQLKMQEFLYKCTTAEIYCPKMHGYRQNIPMPMSSPASSCFNQIILQTPT
jgi:hypothetical protein